MADVSTTVAIVEDHADVCKSWAQLLENAGLSLCLQLRSAEKALRDIPKHKPDVVLMDLNLPGMSGINVSNN